MQMDGILLVGWSLLVLFGPIVTIALSKRSIGTAKAIWILVVAVTSWFGVLAYFMMMNRSTPTGNPS